MEGGLSRGLFRTRKGKPRTFRGRACPSEPSTNLSEATAAIFDGHLRGLRPCNPDNKAQ